MEGWIKLHRKFLSWEWFEDSNILKIFIYLLLKANHKDNQWKGISIKRGQLITSLKTLNKETKLSVKTIRTCLKKLEKTGEIGKQSGNQYSVITICNYDSYQLIEPDEGKPNGKQGANEGQTKGNKQEEREYKNEEEENKQPVFNFRKSLLDLEIEKQIVSDYLKVRSKKKATNSETAFKKIKTEIEKSGITANECIKKAVEKSWAGFESSWLISIIGKIGTTNEEILKQNDL